MLQEEVFFVNAIKQPAQAGTLESNDITVTIAPAANGISIDLTSIVMVQYGDKIRTVIETTLKEQGIANALVKANDRGALDCTIQARVLTALARSGAVVKEVIS